MEATWRDLLQLLSYVGMVLGLIGTVAPLIPGTILIWLSALIWAWADGFERVGLPTLAIMFLLMLVAELSDLVLATMGARKGGASWQGLAVGGIGAVIGLLVFSLPGALIGAVVGMLAWETYRHRGDWRAAGRSSGGLLCGYLVSIMLKFTLGLIMVAVFAWQAFEWPPLRG